MKKYNRLPIICLLISLLSTYGQAYADAPLIWSGLDAKLLNNRGLLGADGTAYPRNYLGPKNYLAQGSSRTTGWGVTGAQTLTPVTSGLPEPSIGTGIYIAPGAVGDYAYFNFKIDPSDSTVQQKISWAQLPAGGYAAGYQKADVYSCTVAWVANACSGTSARLPLTTDASAVTAISGAQNFTSYFAAPSFAVAPFLQLRVTTVTATGNLTLSSVYVGPGQSIQGAVVGPWLSYTPTFANFGTVTINTAEYRQVGASIEGRLAVTTGTPVASVANFNLPTGFTTSVGVPGAVKTVIGRWTRSSGSGSTVKSGPILANSLTDGALYFGYDDYTTGQGAFNFVNGNSVVGGPETLEIQFSVKIDQLIGSGTVNLAQNDLQYYYGTGGTWGTPGTLTSAQGPGGVAGGNTTPSSNVFTYVITPVTKIPVGTTVTFESSPDQINWSKGTNPQLPSGTLEALRYDGTNFIGANAVLSSSGNINVSFGKYANGVTSPYSSLGTWYWRVTVGLPGQAVGFAAYVPGQSSGLVPAVGLPGSTSGVAPCTGCVGELVESKGSGTITTTPVNLLSITLTPGNWDVSALANYYGAAGPTQAALCLSTTSASCSPPVVQGYDYAIFNIATNGVGSGTIPRKAMPVSTTTTVYLVSFTNTNSGTTYASISARRVQ